MKNSKLQLRAQCFVNDNNILYFFARDINLLYCVDLETGLLKICGSIPDEGLIQSYIVTSLGKWNGNIVLTPNRSEKIWLYNIKEQTWKYLDVFGEKKYVDCKCWQSEIVGDTLYMFGYAILDIICVNLRDETIKFLNIEAPIKDRCYMFNRGLCRNGNIIYALCDKINYLCKFNGDSEQIEWIKLPEGHKFYSIAYDGADYWLAPDETKSICKWDGNSNYSMYLLPSDFNLNKPYFLNILCDEETVVIATHSDGKTLFIDKYSGQIARREKLDYDILMKEKRTIYSLDRYGNGYIKNRENGELIKFSCLIEREDLLKHYLQNSNMVEKSLCCAVEETDTFDLEVLSSFIIDGREDCEKSDKCIGKEIYSSIGGS